MTRAIDKTHSEVSFTRRHMMVARVRGTFRDFEADAELAESVAQPAPNEPVGTSA